MHSNSPFLLTAKIQLPALSFLSVLPHSFLPSPFVKRGEGPKLHRKRLWGNFFFFIEILVGGDKKVGFNILWQYSGGNLSSLVNFSLISCKNNLSRTYILLQLLPHSLTVTCHDWSSIDPHSLYFSCFFWSVQYPQSSVLFLLFIFLLYYIRSYYMEKCEHTFEK